MQKFKINILRDANEINADNDNVDVEVTLHDGAVYSATFFTLKNISGLLQNYRLTGECARGTYIWSADMIIVEVISVETINKSIEDLISTEEIYTACSRIR